MSMVLTLFMEVCLPLVVVAGTGWLMDRRFKLHLESMVKLNLYLMVPAFIFVRLLDTPVGGREALWIIVGAVSVMLSCGVLSLLCSKTLRLPLETGKAHALASMLGNAGNFGIPLITLAFGEAAGAVQVYVLVTANVSMFTFGVFLANVKADGGWRGHHMALLATLRQPSIYAVMAAMICKALGLPVQSVGWLWEPLEIMASCLVGFALLTLGVQLSQTKPAALRPPLLSALAIRLLGAPLIAWGVTWLLPVPDATAAVLILAAGAPTAVNTALLAHEFGGDREFATASVFYSTLLSLITVTFTLTLLKV
jgi:malate permease and related proteins